MVSTAGNAPTAASPLKAPTLLTLCACMHQHTPCARPSWSHAPPKPRKPAAQHHGSVCRNTSNSAVCLLQLPHATSGWPPKPPARANLPAGTKVILRAALLDRNQSAYTTLRWCLRPPLHCCCCAARAAQRLLGASDLPSSSSTSLSSSGPAPMDSSSCGPRNRPHGTPPYFSLWCSLWATVTRFM